MNPIEKAKAQPLRTLADSGYKGWPYIHTNLHQYPVTFMWWAKTPTGRQSKHWHAETRYRAMPATRLGRTKDGLLTNVALPSRFYRQTTQEIRDNLIEQQASLLPRLPAGYEWQGPFVYSDCAPPVAPTDTFRWREPDESERGVQLGYMVPGTTTLAGLLAKGMQGHGATA